MKISVCVRALKDTTSLSKQWNELFQVSRQSVFLDWHWISAWMKSLPSAPIVIEAKYQDKLLGLGLLCQNTKPIFFNSLAIKQLWLHKYGDDLVDQSWIEHNDFLLDKNHEDTTRKALLEYIKNSLTPPWDEFYMGMSQQSQLTKCEAVLGTYRTIVFSADFSVDLTEMEDVTQYLASLSKNTRAQINRSLKLINKLGQIELSIAKTEQEKRNFFEQISSLHQKKWRNTELGSGFNNAIFVNFHKNIIFNDINNDYSDIYALKLNDQNLALLYLLKTKDTWYFYLSGIDTHSDNRIKIGLVAHTLVIEQAIKCNIKKYSFLAGDARYKQSMSNVVEESQALVCFSKPSTLLLLIKQLRHFKQRLFPTSKN